MNNKKIGIIGHFGIGGNYTDGQTIKTKELYKELKKQKDLSIDILDTCNYKKKIKNIIFNCIKLLNNCDYLILIVASGGSKVLIPFLTFLNFFKKKKICYCAVGSWVDVRVKNNLLLRHSCKKLNLILVETNELKEKLMNMGFDNVEKMYNFKDLNEFTITDNKRITNSFCIFSRIIKEKGIEDAIYAINRLKEDKIKCNLYIYGPVDKKYEDEFNELISNNKLNVLYCGCIKSEESKKYISKYWMLLFPTHYLKEGLPGTLIDAYNSETPVIASNWLSAKEFVPDSVGYRYEFADKDQLYSVMKDCINNKNEVEKKRKNTKKFVENFKPENAIKPLLDFLDI